ncbi:embigin [Nelusetta ayraudi]|uniref:embigin n=1 Tax=Nelusetta ayraudi TaxID=303726 RepID=UPI003F723B18
MAAAWKKLCGHVLLLLAACVHGSAKSPDQNDQGTSGPQVNVTSQNKTFTVKGGGQTEIVELHQSVNLTLECIWAGNATKPGNVTGLWRRDWQEIGRVTAQLEDGQYSIRRVFYVVSQESLGNYSCTFGGEAGIDFVLTAPQMGEQRDKPIVSYVGDTVVIMCKMGKAKPEPSNWTWYRNDTEQKHVALSEPGRYEVKNEKNQTHLVVHNLTEADSGLYYCSAIYPIGSSTGHVELKVISFSAPLKPFIAIVVEVVVLVAAILLYEKSRSKKNPTEENGISEQTNTLTQGETNGADPSSSMRQRKI